MFGAGESHATPLRVLMIGDSITYGIVSASVGPDYDSLVSASIGTDYEVERLGCGGGRCIQLGTKRVARVVLGCER